MQHLHPIRIPVPPMLEEILGYADDTRYIAFYWTPFGDEVMWERGWSRATGNWVAWLILVRHPRIAPALSSYHLGSSNQEATHWLLLDRHERTLSVGLSTDVYAFLREVNRPATWVGEPDAEPVVIDAAFLEAFVDLMAEVQFPLTAEALDANLADQDLQLRRLQAWLDALSGCGPPGKAAHASRQTPRGAERYPPGAIDAV